MHSASKIRAITFYLPQYYPVVENDLWWGKGFTEWTNVSRAKPLFRGHYQPHVPADLGFYDLRVPEVRQAQAEMARDYRVEAFCYWHYWFAGRRILERPFQEVLATGRPDFPFCLAWANETWSGVWYGEPKRVLIEQTYPGEADYRAHFEWLLTAFRDGRYVRVEGRPLLFIYRPQLVPDLAGMARLFRKWAVEGGLPGLHLVGFTTDPAWSGRAHGLDAVSMQTLGRATGGRRHGWQRRLRRWTDPKRGLGRLGRLAFGGVCDVLRYADVAGRLTAGVDTDDEYYPCVLPNWDNTPRSGERGVVLHESSPEHFRLHLRSALAQVADLPPERRIVFVKAWNEWAEGNHLEPDLRYGRRFLEVLRDELSGQVPA